MIKGFLNKWGSSGVAPLDGLRPSHKTLGWTLGSTKLVHLTNGLELSPFKGHANEDGGSKIPAALAAGQQAEQDHLLRREMGRQPLGLGLPPQPPKPWGRARSIAALAVRRGLDSLLASFSARSKLNSANGSTMAEACVMLHVERLLKGRDLATSEAIQGLVAQGRTVSETLEIARDVARRLMQAQQERQQGNRLDAVSETFDVP